MFKPSRLFGGEKAFPKRRESGRARRRATPDLRTSPLGLLLLHDLLALLSPALVDGVARVVDLERVLVLHVGVLDFPALLVELQNVGHPKPDGERRAEFKASTESVLQSASAYRPVEPTGKLNYRHRKKKQLNGNKEKFEIPQV